MFGLHVWNFAVYGIMIPLYRIFNTATFLKIFVCDAREVDLHQIAKLLHNVQRC